MGQSSQFICQKQPSKSDTGAGSSGSGGVGSLRSPQSNEASSSDEEEDEEVDMPPHLIRPPPEPDTGPPSSDQAAKALTENQPSQPQSVIFLSDLFLI